MPRTLLRGAALVAAMLACARAGADELLPLQRGVAVVTLQSSTPPNVVLVLDVRGAECDPSAVHGEDWPAPRDANELPNATSLATDQWTVSNLGEVYGVTLDDAPNPNVYVTATRCYRGAPPSSGLVHRLDGTTGAISVFAVLPNAGQAGLGNITFDALDRQFFVSNMEDGRIYRLGLDGSVLQAFDPFLPDDGTPGFPPLGDRAWGLSRFEDRLYFGTWTEDMTRRRFVPNGVYSVAIDECGAITGTERVEITLPRIPARDYTQPVSDIAFSRDGRMLVGERCMESDTSSDAHDARVLEFERVGGSWVASSRIFQVGGGTDSGGGVDYAECVSTAACASAEAHVLATGDRLVGNGAGAVHGLQVFAQDGGTPSDSYVIDFSPGKRGIGCVETVRHDPCRVPPAACGVTPGVSVELPACRGMAATLDASSSTSVRCCGTLEWRFTAPAGVVARDWSPADLHATSEEGEWQVDVRCPATPGCEARAAVPVDIPDDLPGAPQVVVEQVGSPDCTRPGTTLRVLPGSFGPCSAPSWQWFQDGVAISGATADAHVIPATVAAGTHSYVVELSCPEALPCGSQSPPVDVTLADFADGPVIVLEETPASGCARPARRLRVVAGSFGACSAPALTWYRDGAVVAGAAADSLTIPETDPPGTSSWHVVVSCPEPLPCGDTSAPVSVTLEALPTPPLVTLDVTPPAGCAQPRRVLSVVPASVAGCSSPSYQWLEDGRAIAGATGDSYEVPSTAAPGRHEYAAVVSCPEPLPCGDTSSPIGVLVDPLPGTPLVTLEERQATDCARDAVVLRLVPASLGTCTNATYQWLEDGVPIAGADTDAWQVPDTTPAGTHEYVLLVDCDEDLPCGDRSDPVRVLIEDPPPGPQLDVAAVPGSDCVRERHVLSVVAGSFGDCSLPEYQWYHDGFAIPGATGATYEVPATEPAGSSFYGYRVTCPEPLPCGDSSPQVMVTLTDFPNPVAQRNIDGLLRVAKAAPATSLRMSWGDAAPEAMAYNLYEGSISFWYTHARQSCGMLRTPAGAPAQETTIAPRAGNAYYLVAPTHCRGEGLDGADSFGVPHPIAGIGTPCGAAP